jgi:hypothetical protein
MAAGVALAAVLAGGCATLPSSGQPQSASTVPPQGGGVSTSGELIVQPPQPGWSAVEVVSNFLYASTNAAHNYRMARAYLTKSASALWHPGSQVTILSGVHITQQPGHLRVGVLVGGHELATLSSNGQYIQATSDNATLGQEEFGLESSNGIEKIAFLPQSEPGKAYRQLLLTSGLFRLAYAPRDIYYYGRGGLLLPDPVYVPIQGTNPVSTLVSDLRHNPAGLLGDPAGLPGDGAARTYFPADAKLAGLQVLPGPSGRTAIVNIALPHDARGAHVAKMAAQLVSTLTSPAFSPPLFHAVRLRINGRLWPGAPRPQNLTSYQAEFPYVPRGMNVYYLAEDGSVRVLGATSRRSIPLPSASGVSQPPLSRVAVSPAGPGGTYLAGISESGTSVYTGGLTVRLGQPPVAAQLHARLTGAEFTSLSWDRNGNLWVAGRTGKKWNLWVLIHGQGTPMTVPDPLPPSEAITAVRVAPDGVRVALTAGGQVWLAAAVPTVTRPAGISTPHNPTPGPAEGFTLTHPVPLGGQGGSRVLTGVRSLTWYDEDHLLAVAGPSNATQLWQVPVDGESPTLVPAQPGLASVTAAGPGNPLYLAGAGQQLDRVVGPNQIMEPITAGQAPSYPG